MSYNQTKPGPSMFNHKSRHLWTQVVHVQPFGCCACRHRCLSSRQRSTRNTLRQIENSKVPVGRPNPKHLAYKPKASGPEAKPALGFPSKKRSPSSSVNHNPHIPLYSKGMNSRSMQHECKTCKPFLSGGRPTAARAVQCA